MTRLRLDLRRQLLLSVLGAVALVLVVFIFAFNVVLRDRLSNEANNALFARASAELASLKISGNRLAAPELPDAAALDAQTSVFAGPRLLELPRTDLVHGAAAQSLNGGSRRTREVPATRTRLYSVPVVANRRANWATVVAGVSRRPYDNTEHSLDRLAGARTRGADRGRDRLAPADLSRAGDQSLG